MSVESRRLDLESSSEQKAKSVRLSLEMRTGLAADKLFHTRRANEDKDIRSKAEFYSSISALVRGARHQKCDADLHCRAGDTVVLWELAQRRLHARKHQRTQKMVQIQVSSLSA